MEQGNRNVTILLCQLETFQHAHKVESDYHSLEEDGHPQQIQSDEMMVQKLEYYHNNPAARGHVDMPEHWRYNSVRNYLGRFGLKEIVTHRL